MSQHPVLIAGAGLGGLLLAQGLLNAGVPFRILERDASLDARNQGYRMRSRQEACEAIERLIPPAMFQRIKETAATNFAPGHMRSAETGEAQESLMAVAAKQTTVPSAVVGLNLLIDRSILRRLLFEGLEPYASFGNAVTSFETSDEGVTATLADGSKVEGSLLVAADGRNSAIMRQLRNGSSADIDSGLRFYYGKTPLTDVARREIGSCFLEGFQITHEQYGQPTGPTITTEPAIFTHKGEPHMADYLYFAFQGYDDELGAAAPTSGGQAAKDFLLARSKGYSPDVRAIFEHCDPAQLTGFRYLTADPRGIPAWPTNPRVTAMGDAVHVMPPTGAFGGTATLIDAAELCAVVSKAWEGRSGSAWAVGEEDLARVEAESRGRGTKMLNLAIERGVHFRLRPVV